MWTHSSSSVVLPKPGGAEIRVSFRAPPPSPALSRSIRCGRCTILRLGGGIWSFEVKSTVGISPPPDWQWGLSPSEPVPSAVGKRKSQGILWRRTPPPEYAHLLSFSLLIIPLSGGHGQATGSRRSPVRRRRAPDHLCAGAWWHCHSRRRPESPVRGRRWLRETGVRLRR
jgi:hypothetical protein